MPIIKIKLGADEMESVERAAYRILLADEDVGVEKFSSVGDVYKLALNLGLDALAFKDRKETNAVSIQVPTRRVRPQTPALELAPADGDAACSESNVKNSNFSDPLDTLHELIDDTSDPLPPIEYVLASRSSHSAGAVGSNESLPTMTVPAALKPAALKPAARLPDVETNPLSLESQTPALPQQPAPQLTAIEREERDALQISKISDSLISKIRNELQATNYLVTLISRPDNSTHRDEKIISVPQQYEITPTEIVEHPYEYDDNHLPVDSSWRQVLRQHLQLTELARHDYYAEFGMRRWHYTFETNDGVVKTLIFYWSPNSATWADRYDVPVPAFQNDKTISIGYASMDDMQSDLAGDDAETVYAARRFAHRIALVEGDPTPEQAVRMRFKPSRVKVKVKPPSQEEILAMTLASTPS